jgi:hypothetical protein
MRKMSWAPEGPPNFRKGLRNMELAKADPDVCKGMLLVRY